MACGASSVFTQLVNAIGLPAPQAPALVGVNPYFHIAILMMILGCMLFLAGFLAELIIRNSPSRNDYLIKEEI